MIEKFATGCCLYSVLDKSFDLRDANTVIILQFAILVFAVLKVNLYMIIWLFVRLYLNLSKLSDTHLSGSYRHQIL